MRRNVLFCVTVGVVISLHTAAQAQIGASVTYTSNQVNGTQYQYDFTVTNTGTTDIATFWVGWTAAAYHNYGYIYDLLSGIPSVNNSPTGWVGVPEADSAFGGYSVMWYGFGTSLAAGQSLSDFTFTTTDTPDQMANGPSIIGLPRSTSWVYVGSAQSGGTPGDQGSVESAQAVPEPALAGTIIPAIAFGLLRRRPVRLA